jgi:hypothetical protein
MPKHCETGEGQCGKGRNGQEHLPGPTGYGSRHGGKDRQSKLGNLSGRPWIRLTGADPLYEYINRRKCPRDSDAAIVSDDLVGQQNPLASQGPLDWRRPDDGPDNMSERTTGEPAEGGRWRISRRQRCVGALSCVRQRGVLAKVAMADIQFEAVLEKTHRTEF